jgi:hypothetical protein
MSHDTLGRNRTLRRCNVRNPITRPVLADMPIGEKQIPTRVLVWSSTAGKKRIRHFPVMYLDTDKDLRDYSHPTEWKVLYVGRIRDYHLPEPRLNPASGSVFVVISRPNTDPAKPRGMYTDNGKVIRFVVTPLVLLASSAEGVVEPQPFLDKEDYMSWIEALKRRAADTVFECWP